MMKKRDVYNFLIVCQKYFVTESSQMFAVRQKKLKKLINSAVVFGVNVYLSRPIYILLLKTAILFCEIHFL